MDWYGQGRIGTIGYDWKMILDKGRSAIFSSVIESSEPEAHQIKGRLVLVFPNPNSPRNHGKISRAKFFRIIEWIEQCLIGDVTSLEASMPNKASISTPDSCRVENVMTNSTSIPRSKSSPGQV